MRWNIIRLIWVRELRDQLRDRRTLFMIAVLPILLYPVAGFGLLSMFAGLGSETTRIGIVGEQDLPEWSAEFEPALEVSELLAVTPSGPGCPLEMVGRSAAASSLRLTRRRSDPPLLRPSGSDFRFLASYFESAGKVSSVVVLRYDSVSKGHEALQNQRIDLLIVVPPLFSEKLAGRTKFSNDLRSGEIPELKIRGRDSDDRSRLANARVTAILVEWKRRLKEARFLRQGLPVDFDEPYRVEDPEKEKPILQRTAAEVFKMLGQIFPFVLVMWSMAGALYPAIDLCAGEKERGTMETLLISPASREEIVWGKFLTIWVFSGATALLNLLSMGITAWWFVAEKAQQPFPLGMLLWGIVLLLPLSAFFSALALAVGVYARSSKEGQYYLMPLFLITMPLVFLTLLPSIELNAFYSMVPVTGIALLLQTLVSEPNPATTLALYFIPVLAPMVVYSWLALRWAIEQFQREEVLFREAEQLDLGLWLRRLWRDKEALPSAGQAFFAFGVVLLFTRLALSLGDGSSAVPRFLIGYIAFVFSPPFLMAILLTTKPLEGLALRPLSMRMIVLSVALALLLIVPATQATYFIFQEVPGLKDALRDNLEEQHRLGIGEDQFSFDKMGFILSSLFLLSGVMAMCEELAFRGFIFSGLRRRFRPWTAVLLSSFLFALFRMDVFQFIPHFLVGIVMALLVQRSGSVAASFIFRFLHNTLVYVGLLLLPLMFPTVFRFFVDGEGRLTFSGLLIGGLSLCLAVGLLARLSPPTDEGSDRPEEATTHPPKRSKSPVA